MSEDLQDPKNIEPAGEPAPGAEPSQPAGDQTPESPQPSQASSDRSRSPIDDDNLLPRESDEGLQGPTGSRSAPTTGGLIQRLTGALRMVTRPLRDTGRLQDAESLNRTGVLRGDLERNDTEETRPGVTGHLRSTGALNRTGMLRSEPGGDPAEEPRPGVTEELRSTPSLEGLDSLRGEASFGETEEPRPGVTGELRSTGSLHPADLPTDDAGRDRAEETRPGESGDLRLTGSLNRTGMLRSETGNDQTEESRPGVSGYLRSSEPPTGEDEGKRISPGLEAGGPAPSETQPESPPTAPQPSVESGDALASRLNQLSSEPEPPKIERGAGTGSLIERLTGTLRQTTGALRQVTGQLRTGPLRRTGPLGEGGTGEGAQGEGQPGAEGAPGRRPTRVVKPSPEAYIPELRQTLAEDEESQSGRQTGGFFKRLTGTLRKVTGPLHGVTGPLRGTGPMRVTGTLRDDASAEEQGSAPESASQTGPEAGLPGVPTGLPAIVLPEAEPEIADDFLADRLGTASLVESEDVPPAYSTGWEDISVPPGPDFDITSEMLAETGPLTPIEEPTLTGEEPISLLDSGAIAAMGRAEEAEQAQPDWMTEIRQEAATQEPGGAASGLAGEEKPRKKGITGRLKAFITGILERPSEEKRRTTGELPDDLVTGRLERSMTTAELEAQKTTTQVEPTAQEEGIELPEDRFTFGEAVSPAEAVETEETGQESPTEEGAGFDFWTAARRETEAGDQPGFTFGEIYEEQTPGQVSPLDAETEAPEAPFGGESSERGQTRSLDDFDLNANDEGPLAARFQIFEDQEHVDQGGSVEEAPTFEELMGDQTGYPGAVEVGPVEVEEPGEPTGEIDIRFETPESEEPSVQDYKLSPEEEALLWGRPDNLRTRGLSDEEGPSIEEIWAPTGDKREKPEPNPDLADLNEATDLRDMSLEDRTARPQPPTGGLFLPPMNDDAYAAAFLAGIDLPPEDLEFPKEDMLRKALEQADETEGGEEPISIQDLRTVALEGYQEAAAPRAPLVEEVPAAAGAEAEGAVEGEAAGQETASALEADLAPARGFRAWFKERTIVEKVLLVEAAVVALAMLVAVPFFIYTIVRGPTRQAVSAPVNFFSPHPLPADLPTPTGLVLPGGWYFDLAKSTFVKGEWKPNRSEWLEGSELNRAIALPWNPQTEAVIQTFKPGDRVKLDLSNGKSLVYTISEIRRVPVSDKTIFDSNRPTLVVILYKENAQERWVVFCKP